MSTKGPKERKIMNRLKMISLVPAFTVLSAVAPAKGKKTVPVLLSLLAVLLSGLSAWGQALAPWQVDELQKKNQYVGQMIESLVDVGHIDPWNTCHAIQISIDAGWGYAKLPTRTVQKPDGSIEFAYAVLQNRTVDLTFDLADVDTSSVKRTNFYPMKADLSRAFRVSGKVAFDNLATVPVISFETHSLNGVTETELDLKALNAFGDSHQGQSGITDEQFLAGVGATRHHGKMGWVWFSDGVHAEAFQDALTKAAIACTTQ
jgi:hypothetical protein